MSCYALFQGWLLLSQPPGCLGTRTSLPTQPTLGDLSRRSGLFPSRRWTFSPTVSLLTPASGLRRLARLGRRQAPAPNQCSTSAGARVKADPQAISGRTSYLPVRLAFHPYPQLLRAVCNRHRCGPPRGLTRASAWPWVAHRVSGRPPATCAPSSDSRSLRLRVTLPSPRHGRPLAGSCSNRHAVTSSRWLRPSGSARFQALFHPPRRGPFHRSLTVLLHYRSTGVFSLGGWSPQLPAGLPVSRGTHGPTRSRCPTAYGTLTLSGRPFQQRSAQATVAHSVPGWPPRPVGRPTPSALRSATHVRTPGLGSSRFARHYSGNPLSSSGY